MTDPDGDPVTYEIQVDNNSDFSSPVSLSPTASGLSTTTYTPTTTLTVGAAPGTVYFWRVRANDGALDQQLQHGAERLRDHVRQLGHLAAHDDRPPEQGFHPELHGHVPQRHEQGLHPADQRQHGDRPHRFRRPVADRHELGDRGQRLHGVHLAELDQLEQRPRWARAATACLLDQRHVRRSPRPRRTGPARPYLTGTSGSAARTSVCTGSTSTDVPTVSNTVVANTAPPVADAEHPGRPRVDQRQHADLQLEPGRPTPTATRSATRSRSTTTATSRQPRRRRPAVGHIVHARIRARGRHVLLAVRSADDLTQSAYSASRQFTIDTTAPTVADVSSPHGERVIRRRHRHPGDGPVLGARDGDRLPAAQPSTRAARPTYASGSGTNTLDLQDTVAPVTTRRTSTTPERPRSRSTAGRSRTPRPTRPH